MAAKGQLAPDDLVRRADMKTPREASTIKGLFAAAESTKPSPPPSTEAAPPPAAPKKSGPSKKTLIIASVVGGACLLLCCGGFGIIAFFGAKMQDTTRKQLAEGDALWEKGDKAGGAAKYRAIFDDHRVHFLKEEDRPRLYGRLIDFEYDSGHADAGKALIDKADKEGITPAVNHTDAKAVVATIQAERARVEAEKAEKKRLAEAKKKEEERQAKLTPLDKLKEAPLSELVHAAVLYGDFNGNEVAAAEKYKGKTIMVVGEVESVEKGGALSSDRIILARSRGGLAAVYCAVSGGNSGELAKLRPGDYVRVQGKCDGKAFSGTVEMSGCIFVKVPTD